VQILLVEDDRELRRFLSKAFREEGYGVTEAETGDRALERALGGGFGCIVLDVMLPGRTASVWCRSCARAACSRRCCC